MSIAEFPSAPSTGELIRTPPQDLAAEQSVLGGMLLSKDAIADVVEVVRGHDFYRPAHELVYEAVLDLYGRGEPADAVTVSAELQKRGELGRVGGAPYLHTLLQSVPTAANAGYYAKIVRETAVLRRLIEAGTKIVQMGYAGDGDSDDIVDAAQVEVYNVTDRRTSDDYLPLSAIMEGTLDEIEAIGSRGGEMVGVPTGFVDFDELTNGLHAGQMIVLAARPAVGKALALDTPLVTPTGWTTMGDVQVGDRLMGADGRPTTVVAATEVMSRRPCYEVEFADGTVLVADAHHQWLTETRANRRREGLVPGAVRTTQEVLRTLRLSSNRDERLNHTVRNAAPLTLPDADLPLPPYTLGVWLGDGHSASARCTSADPEVAVPLGRVSQPHPGSPADASRPAALSFAPRRTQLRGAPPPARIGRLDARTGRERVRRHALEADGLRVVPRSELNSGLHLGDEPASEGRRCVACGTPVIPHTSRGHAGGRSCGGRPRTTAPRTTPPACPDCGGPSSGLRRCAACHAHHGTVPAILGLLGEKHIPRQYLRAGESQRRLLLAGLLDTLGTVTTSGAVQLAVASERLAADVYELVVSLGYTCGRRTTSVKGRSSAPSTAFLLTFSTHDDVFRLGREALVHKDRRSRRDAQIGRRYIVDVRPVPSVPVRCVEVDNADHLYLAGRALVPTHNSTLGLDIARSAAIKSNMTTCIFSLEMSRNEITMRLLSAEARVPLHHMRTGRLTDDDWTRLARRMGEVSNAPLFIDDSPNMSMMEIRAKCRRLKQRNDLKLVIIDYLQLMSSGKRVESRQQEVSEFSRAIKLLAKELEVPVVAISQLNRGSEQRTDKKPQMSDLRESGCLPASTRVMRADTGAEVTLGELLAEGARDVPVWSLDDSLRYVPRVMTHVFPTGRREVFALQLASGKTVQATANHPFLTYDGWRALGGIEIGGRLAVPRHVPAPSGAVHDAAVVPAFPLPRAVFRAPKTRIASTLWGLWREHGGIDSGRDGSGTIWLRCATAADVEDVSRLLLRFGVSVVTRELAVRIVEVDDQRRFLQEIGFPGEDAARMLRHVLAVTKARKDRAAGGSAVWQRVEQLLAVPEVLVGAAAKRTQTLGLMTAVLDEADLEVTATNDVLWDTVVSVTSVGERDVFDATVLNGHNFIADGVAVHNSIEQDADMVVLLHREELYERESPRAGEADFIVAKHRNGPTATITVAFQGHYSRFVDMAQS